MWCDDDQSHRQRKKYGPDYVEDILPHQAAATMPPTVILRQNVE
jgi:hypothetical protein